MSIFCYFFFFQAEDGIRDLTVTGVQTCALPILIKELILFFPLLDRPRALKQPVRQRRFAVIDMRNDAEVARELDCHESGTMRARLRWVNCYARTFPSFVPFDSLD